LKNALTSVPKPKQNHAASAHAPCAKKRVRFKRAATETDRVALPVTKFTNATPRPRSWYAFPAVALTAYATRTDSKVLILSTSSPEKTSRSSLADPEDLLDVARETSSFRATKRAIKTFEFNPFTPFDRTRRSTEPSRISRFGFSGPTTPVAASYEVSA
jgi:hypothetical protein